MKIRFSVEKVNAGAGAGRILHLQLQLALSSSELRSCARVLVIIGCPAECHTECHLECQDQWNMVRSHTVMVWSHLLTKKSLMVVGGGW